ncbi:hypothetical protein [Synechococcus sp. 1G10]|uniref:hypothetical protein n=1 Tax=Synechococcus sp. 1G10 TaxID=2025605 RepID=UPI000B99368E|nr:hypothetical protein [Synechococcus sp. 1G10]
MTTTLAFTFSFVPPHEGEESIGWSQVVADHQASLCDARALRILRCPKAWSGSLDSLVQAGQATISCEDPFVGLPNTGPARERLLCDAVIPRFDASRLWLQVHVLEAGQGVSPTDAPLGHERLDAVPLQQLSNETCWFYPTEDGDYLASERTIDVRFGPGVMAEPLPTSQPLSYDRGDLRLLWSLMADDEDLSCVGLTYQRRRIEFPRQAEQPATTATWSSFRVDGMASPSFQRLSTISTYG